MALLAVGIATSIGIRARSQDQPDQGSSLISVGRAAYAARGLLVRFRPGVAAAARAAAHAAEAGEVVRTYATVPGLQLVRLPAGTRVEEALAHYQARADVLYAEPDYEVTVLGERVPNDPRYAELWGLHNAAQTPSWDPGVAGADIHAPEAWAVTTGSRQVVVAVVDTGVDYTHPDLQGNLWRNEAECTANGVDDDRNGYVDDCYGIDTFNHDGDPRDDHSHGTHVAGTIGARGDNGIGVAGVNWAVSMVACKFLGAGGSGSTSGAIACLDYLGTLADRGVPIVASNNSWGGGGYSQALADAIAGQLQRGVLFIAAAGNAGANNDLGAAYPANYFLPNVVAVAATTAADGRARFSSYGRQTVHLSAPGQGILSTTPNNTYASYSGTSMATPHVTGVAALLKAADPARDWRAIRNLLLAGGDPKPAQGTVTGRRLNAAGALGCTTATVRARVRPLGTRVTATVGEAVPLAALHLRCADPAGALTVAVAPGGDAVLLRDDGVAPDQVAGDGSYAGAFVPPGAGTYTLRFAADDEVTVQVLGSTYGAQPGAGAYRTMAGTSLEVADETSAKLVPPFPLRFGDGTFDAVYVSDNGVLRFDRPVPPSFYVPQAMPTTAVSTLLAPFWMDLYPTPETGQTVYWAVQGTAPARELIIEWRNVTAYTPCGDDTSNTVRFQVVFFEDRAEVLFNYADVTFGGVCAGADRGGQATVGVQVGEARGSQFSRNQAALSDGLSLGWIPTSLPDAPPGVATHPANQAVTVGGTATFTVAATGTPAPTVQWEVSADGGSTWAVVEGATASSHNVTAAASDHGKQFRGVFTNRNGTATTNAATLSIHVAPSVTTHPSNQTVMADGTATFLAAATGTPAPTLQWQVSADGGSTWADVGGAKASPYSFTAAASDHGKQFRGAFTNSASTVTTNAARLTVIGALGVSPASLRYGVTKAGAGGALTSVTPAQAVMVSFTGAPSAWTAAAAQPWIQVSGGAGSTAGQFTVGIVDPGNAIGGSATLSGTVTVTATGVSNSPLSIPVTLTVDQSGGATAQPPLGQVDTPLQNAAGIVGAIGVTGWALDDVGVTGVKIYRKCLAFENPASCQAIGGASVVFVGDAAFLSGARPDVEAAFPGYPEAHRAGWGYLLLTSMLPDVVNGRAYGGQGSVTLYAFATDAEGKTTLLGRSQDDHTPTTITMANASIGKPFGAIDTPGQGETVSGIFPNFGWALTPDSNTTAEAGDIVIPPDGSSMVVFIDGIAAANVAYNQCRGSVGNPVPAGVYCDDDVASVFGNPTPQPTFTLRTANPTKYRNLDAGRAAIGAYDLDTTTLANGVHTIAWSVTDSAGRNEGIGSRFFTVLNSGTDAGRDSGFGPSPLRHAQDRPEQGRGAAGSGPPRATSRGGVRDSGAARHGRPGVDGPGLPGPPDATLSSRAASGVFANPQSRVPSLDQAGPIRGRTGFDLRAPLEIVPADEAGVRHIQLAELGRLELDLGPVDAGCLEANGTRRDLPAGSHLDAETGLFTWAPGPGYVGTYRLAFARAQETLAFDVTIRPVTPPAPGESEIRMHVDLPREGDAPASPVRIAGWALDPQAGIGSGIGAVHVWAQRRDLPGAWPEFLGAAALDAARPDVARAFGAQSTTAGFDLTTAALAPGRYDLTVYAWNRRTGRWEDARTVAVAVR